MNDRDIIINYFQIYLQKITKGRKQFFVSFCNVDSEIFEILAYERKFLKNDISAVFLDNDAYDEAVRLRNDENEQKIVVLTSKSVKNIDSLKHFSEYEIFPDRDDPDLLWDILKELFKIESDEKNYQRFFLTIVKYKKITLLQLITYIVESRNLEGRIQNSLLNSNLNLLGCWKAGPTSQLVTISILRKIIRASDPSQIKKRLDNITQNKSKMLNNRGKKEIEKLIFDNNYQKLMADYDFSQVQEYFEGRRNHSQQQEKIENIQQIYFSLQEFRESKKSYNTLEEFEDDMLCEEGYFDDSQYLKYSEAFNRLKKYNIDKESFLFDISEIQAKIKENAINVRPRVKEEFLKLLEELGATFESLYDKTVGNIAYPFVIKHYVEIAYQFMDKYFEMLKCILKDQMLQITLSQFQMFDKIMGLFLVHTDSGYLMPFFHPLLIAYFFKLLKIHEKLDKYLSDNEDDIIEYILENTFEVIMDKFPINMLSMDSKRYQFNNNTGYIPFYIEFVPSSENLSKSNVEPNLIYKKVEDYIEKHSYLSELRVLVVGNLDLDTMGNLENRIKALSQSRGEFPEEVVITIAAENVERIRNQIDTLFTNDSPLDIIKFKIWSGTESSEEGLHRMVNNNQIVFVLDSQLLYAQPKLLEIVNQKSVLSNRLKQQDVNGYIEHFIDDDVNDISLLWDTLQNISLNGSSAPARWNYGQLNAKTFNDIIQEVNRSHELNIIVYSSNLDFVNHIFIQQNMYQTMLVSSKNRSMVQISFYASKEERLEKKKQALYPECFIVLEDMLDTVIKRDNEDIFTILGLSRDTDLGSFYLRFSLEEQSIKIDTIIPKNQKEVIFEEELTVGIARILEFIYQKNGNVFLNTLKKSLSNYMYSQSSSYSDSFLSLYLSNSFFITQQGAEVNICYEDYTKQNNQFDCYNAKQFCDFIHQNNVFDEATIYDFKSRFENTDLDSALVGAQALSKVVIEYEERVKMLIKEVN